MLCFLRRLFLAIFSCLAPFAMDKTAMAGDVLYNWDRYQLGESSTWASYFRANARIHLGREQRLPNGVSWRLLTDTGSGLAMPRLTWMPHAKRLEMANHLLDVVHGGEMLVEKQEWRTIMSENDLRKRAGVPPLRFRHALRQEVSLTFVGSRLMSLAEALMVNSSGTHPVTLLRGLTFDLESGVMIQVAACPGTDGAYGFPGVDAQQRGNFLFRYGELLQLCDLTVYRRFIALAKDIDTRMGRHLPASADDRSKGCVESSNRPVFREEQEYVLYLTFAGLAVKASGPECPVWRTRDNPVIIPYRKLEPFMQPGPWRDELLALR